MSATILAVHTKPSGAKRLPKVPRSHARVTRNGIEGDYNHFRHARKNDTPDRALLLLTDDMLFALNKEGFPVCAGDLGENLLITRLPYDALEPGQQYRIGTDLVIEITEQCNPCRNLLKLPYGSAALLGHVGRSWYRKNRVMLRMEMAFWRMGWRQPRSAAKGSSGSAEAQQSAKDRQARRKEIGERLERVQDISKP